MSNVQICSFCTPFEILKKYPIRTTIFVAILIIVALGVLLAHYHPSIGSFFTSKIGYGLIAGSCLVALGILAWIFKPICNGSVSSSTKVAANSKEINKEEKLKNVIDTILQNEKSGENFLKGSISDEKQDKFTLDEKLFKTIADLDALKTASEGDYVLEILRGPYKKMTIKSQKGNFSIYIRESTQISKNYRLLFFDNNKVSESLFLFSAPQISAMMRILKNPPTGIRVSGYTTLLKKTGIIVFTQDIPEKIYFIVNPKGFCQTVSSEDLNRLVNQFNS